MDVKILEVTKGIKESLEDMQQSTGYSEQILMDIFNKLDEISKQINKIEKKLS